MLQFFTFCVCVIILLCLLAFMRTSHEEQRNVYIVVTATPTATYDLFQNICASYCPTPYPKG